MSALERQFEMISSLQAMAGQDAAVALDPYLDEQLNDIDELITSELGQTPTNDNLPQKDSWSTWLKSGSLEDVFLDEPFTGEENCSADSCAQPAHCPTTETRSESAGGVDVEVQICNLRDLYDKKTKKTPNGFEYRLENTRVTIIARASVQLQSLQVFVRRCPDAAIKTHDTIGPMELEAISQQHDLNRTIVTVDLDSVYKTSQGEHVYWLEKAEVEQRNKWELLIALHFVPDGLVASIKSKSFRITTKSSHKARKDSQHIAGAPVSEPLVNRICERVFPVDMEAKDFAFPSPTGDTDHEFNSVVPTVVDPDVDKAAIRLQQELFRLNVDCEEDQEVPTAQFALGRSTSPTTAAGTVVYGRVVLRHDSPLDGGRVTRHYNRDSRTRYAVEQPDLAGLMKIMGRKYHWTGGRRRANGHKTAEENFWWACGFCFFERRKKSTVKAHVVQQVCQKSTERKESSQNASNRRIARCPSYDTAMDSFGPYSASSWKNTQSV